MCVIFACDEKSITDDMLVFGECSNPDGGGIAWIEDETVHYRKGLKGHEIENVLATIALPYIVHFRIGTVGALSDQLTHPFTIPDTSPCLEGTAPAVLFHNGHWARWQDYVLNSVISGNGSIPSGEWSDSRGMAYLATRHGIGVLQMIDEKVAVLSPAGIERFGVGWVRHEGIWCSNMHWSYTTPAATGRIPTKYIDEDAYDYDVVWNGASQRRTSNLPITYTSPNAREWRRRGFKDDDDSFGNR